MALAGCAAEVEGGMQSSVETLEQKCINDCMQKVNDQQMCD